MELDNLKDLWNKDNSSETPEISLEQQKEIHSPLERIRKNMRIEFWYTIISYPIMILMGYWYMKDHEYLNIFMMLLVIGCFLCMYYFLKFKTLYQKINTQDFSTFHKLLNLRYELVLNTELYKSYYVSYIPLMFTAYLLIFGINDNSLSHLFPVIIATILASIFMIFLGNIWLRELYGKYIVEISDRVMELTDEKDDFVFNRKALESSDVSFKPFNSTKKYFVSKLGETSGVWTNYIVWIIMILFGTLVLLFGIGFIVGYLSVYFNR